MKLSEPLLISPLLDGFVMGDPISNHDGVRACPAMQLENEKKHIVKIISLPATQSKLEALLLAGAYADRDSALAYFKELADDVIEEAQLLQKLARNEGFVAFDSWQLVPMENDETGYDVYLLSQYRPTLEGVLRINELTHLQAINLGLDMCAALCVARRFGYLYTNLRPSNIFICNEREFRIGDLGFMRLDSLQYSSLPDKYRSEYTAPEICDAFSALNLTMDTYAAGLILYQAYNDGKLPVFTQPMAAPCHAEPALAEIILKACSQDPNDRWQDPMQMGQALAAYMQTNTVNDTPIVPPAPVVEEKAVAEITPEAEEELSTADILAAVDDALDAVAAMMGTDDTAEADAPTEEPTVAEETAPEDLAAEEVPAAEEAPVAEEAPEEIPTEEISAEEPEAEIPQDPVETTEQEDNESDDVAYILAQADDLIAHQLPETPAAEEEPEPEDSADDEESQQIVAPEVEADIPENPKDQDNESADHHSRRKPNVVKLACILVAVALVLITGITVFYQNYYLQTIQDMIITGSEDYLSVQLVTEIPDEKLTVKCIDTHGNSLTASVVNGIATFEGLKPDTTYTLEVCIEGMHKLMGVIKQDYCTGESTVISGFYATAGLEDGSVILYFTVQGNETARWSVTYSAEGEDPITVSPFTGRQCTLSGLTVGKEYTFTLNSEDGLHISGTNTLKYTISPVIYPEDVRALGFSDKGLGISWNAPAGATVTKWNVRCYNNSGYDQTLSTEDTVIYFAGLDPATDYTVEVKADGMPLGTRIYIQGNALSVKDIKVDDSDPMKLTVTWKSNGMIPNSGWLLLYTIDNSTSQQVINCKDNTAVINLHIPAAHYSIRIKAADGSSVFGGELEHYTPAAKSFSGYLITADNMTFSMCKTPSKSNWDHEDVSAKDYTTSFVLGQSAAFVAHLDTKTSKVDDLVTTLYVIHDHEGRLISAKSEVKTWDEMWDNRYGEYVIPAMPNEAGSYTVDIYFDGALACSQNFSIGAAG